MNQITVPFHGNNLFVINHNGDPVAPMRPIVEGMGLDWKSQHTKIVDRFNTCVVEITTQLPGDTQSRAVTCLPLRKLAGWLMTINANKVKPALRDRIREYQAECDDALWQYWSQGQATNPRSRPDTTRKALPNGLSIEQQDTIKAMVKARAEGLPKDKQAKAVITCWSALKSKFGVSYKEIAPEHYLDAVSLVSRLPLTGETRQAENEEQAEMIAAAQQMVLSSLEEIVAIETAMARVRLYAVNDRLTHAKIYLERAKTLQLPPAA